MHPYPTPARAVPRVFPAVDLSDSVLTLTALRVEGAVGSLEHLNCWQDHLESPGIQAANSWIWIGPGCEINGGYLSVPQAWCYGTSLCTGPSIVGTGQAKIDSSNSVQCGSTVPLVARFLPATLATPDRVDGVLAVDVTRAGGCAILAASLAPPWPTSSPFGDLWIDVTGFVIVGVGGAWPFHWNLPIALDLHVGDPLSLQAVVLAPGNQVFLTLPAVVALKL